MKKVLFLSVFISLSVLCFGQQTTDSIRIVHAGGGNAYFYKNKLLNSRTLTDVLFPVDNSYVQYRKALSSKAISYFFGGLGCIFVGKEAYDYLNKRAVNSTLLGVGAGMMVTSVTFHILKKKQEVKAVELYNEQVKSTKKPVAALKMGIKTDGISIAMNF